MSWLTDTLLVTGALIALVLVLRAPVARLFGPGMAYALWTLPVLRLLVPPLTLPAPPAPVDTLTALPTVVTVLANPVPALAAPPAPVWAYAPLLQTVWLAGALAYLGWRLWQYVAMRRSLLVDAVSVGESGDIRLIECPAAVSPVAFGLRDKVVALPPGFMAQTPRSERDLAIAHELEHHRGRDLAINIAVQPLLALHWFNPLAWLGWKALRRDQEAACDARVLSGREAETRAVYGRLIASFAVNPSPAMASALACPINLEKSIIYRLRSLTMTEPTKTRRLAGRLLIGAAALALPLTATITYAAGEEPAAPAKTEHHKSHKIVIIDVPEGASPDDKDLHTRTVVRNGKTIVLKTKQPLSDAEADARIAKAEAEMPEMPEPPEPPMPPEAPSWEGAPPSGRHVVVMREHGKEGDVIGAKGQPREVRTYISHFDTKGERSAPTIGSACPKGTHTSNVEAATQGEGGKTQHVRVFVCAHDGDQQGQLHGLRSARQKISANPNIPADVKADVLKQLDSEIEKAAKAG